MLTKYKAVCACWCQGWRKTALLRPRKALERILPGAAGTWTCLLLCPSPSHPSADASKPRASAGAFLPHLEDGRYAWRMSLEAFAPSATSQGAEAMYLSHLKKLGVTTWQGLLCSIV